MRDPRLIEDLALQFGSQFVVLAVDAREVEGKWRVHLNGGRIATDILLYDWVREAESRGAGEILFTSMNHDGAKNGFALEATVRVFQDRDANDLDQPRAIPTIRLAGPLRMSWLHTTECCREPFLKGSFELSAMPWTLPTLA